MFTGGNIWHFHECRVTTEVRWRSIISILFLRSKGSASDPYQVINDICRYDQTNVIKNEWIKVVNMQNTHTLYIATSFILFLCLADYAWQTSINRHMAVFNKTSVPHILWNMFVVNTGRSSRQAFLLHCGHFLSITFKGKANWMNNSQFWNLSKDNYHMWLTIGPVHHNWQEDCILEYNIRHSGLWPGSLYMNTWSKRIKENLIKKEEKNKQNTYLPTKGRPQVCYRG